MDPARHIVDSWIDVLDWHSRLKLSLSELVSCGQSVGVSVSDDFSKLEANTIYPLLAEGIELVELFSQSKARGSSFSVTPEKTLSLMSQLDAMQRPLRTISRTKLEASLPGRIIVEHLVADNVCDERHGSPLFYLLFVAWRLEVNDFVRRHTFLRSSSSEHSRTPTLQEAKELNASRPKLEETLRESDTMGHQQINYFRSLSSYVQTSALGILMDLIASGDRAEQEVRSLLLSLKDVFRGSSKKAGAVCDHLAKLKVLQGTFKSQTGLVLDRDLEDTLDRTVRDLGWLVKTFPYAALHSDELLSSSSKVHSEDNQLNGSNKEDEFKHRVTKVPWDVLVSLFERIPSSSELEEASAGGVLARVALRVRELYDSAHAWQEEVSNVMSISFRGLKRRVPSGGITSTEKPTGSRSDSESQSKVDIRTLDRLSKDPILAWVSGSRSRVMTSFSAAIA